MQKHKFKHSINLALISISSNVFAGGFALNEQSTSSMGTAYAGRSSSAIDSTTIYENPAGMSLLSEQASIGFTTINASTDINNTQGTFSGSNDGNIVPFTIIPMGYYVKPLTEKLTIGVGLYTPFGLSTNNENNFQGRYYGDKSSVSVVTLQPTISYRFTQKLSVGFGPTINKVNGELTSALLNPLSPGHNDGRIKVKGNDVGVGSNAGVLYQLTPNTRLGATYHSKVNYTLEGHTTVSGNGAIFESSAGRYKNSLKLTTPESIDGSITHKLTTDLTIYAGITWTRWSQLKEIKVKNNSVDGLLSNALSTTTEEQNWHDTYSQALGVAYQLNKKWVLRTGVAFDQTPTNNTNRSPRVPSGDRTALSLGAGWSPNKNITLDMAYAFIHEEEVSVNRASAEQGIYSANFQNNASLISAQFTYKF